MIFKAHLVSLAKWSSVRLRTKWLWVRVPLQSLIIETQCIKIIEQELSYKPDIKNKEDRE